MGSPGNKPDPDPVKSFEGAQQQNQPGPKTKEKAGQLAVDARYHELENISDPKEREKAEKALRAHAEKTFGATDRYVDKVRDSQAKWEQRLTSLSEKNPIRTAAAPVVRAVQRQQRQKIGSMVLQSARKNAAIITTAQKNSEAFRQRQAQNPQPGKGNDRER